MRALQRLFEDLFGRGSIVGDPIGSVKEKAPYNVIQTKVSLEAVNSANWHAVNALQLAPEQEGFVTSAQDTLMEVSEEDDWILMAVRITGSDNAAGEIVGFAAMIPDPVRPEVLWTHRLMIDKKHQNKGIGTAAKAIITDAAKQSGYTETRSGIVGSNTASFRLGAKFGATPDVPLDDISEGIVVGDEKLTIVDLLKVDVNAIFQGLEAKGICAERLDKLPPQRLIPIPR